MKRVGILSFFPPFTPPRSGGELRLLHIAKDLARRGFDIDLAAPTYGEHQKETIEHSPNFRETRYPKTGVYNKIHGVMDRFTPFRECSGLVCSLAVRRHHDLREAAERMGRESDIYTHESPFLAPIIPRRRRSGQLLVYNSYNVEARMAADMFGRSPQGILAAGWIRRWERWLAREADVVLACSEEDARGFTRLYKIPPTRIAVVPNGVDVHAMTPCPSVVERLLSRDVLGVGRETPVCFFIGSLHPPNLEAVELLLTAIAPAMPDVTFLVAGKACEPFAGRTLPDNLRLLGLVDEETRQALFHGSDVALNPMVSGSGTNLKMLDAFSAGLCVLSTPFGARGLRVEHGNQAWLADLENYTRELKYLLEDAPLRERLGKAARAHVEEHFTWESIGAQVADIYTLKTGKRIFLLSDYTIHPPRHGGQSRGAAVARQLEAAGRSVTILSLGKKCPATRSQITPGIEELVIPRGGLQNVLDSTMARLVGTPVDDLVAWLATGLLTPGYIRELRHETRRGGDVLLEQCFLERYTSIRGIDGIYYDAQNWEHALKLKLGAKHWFARQFFRIARRAEVRATRRATCSFAVTTDLMEELINIAGDRSRVRPCPNGVDTSVYTNPDAERQERRRLEWHLPGAPLAIFLGSGHPPNQAAAMYIIGKLAPALPDLNFIIAGSVCALLPTGDVPKNVHLVGALEESAKIAHLEAADIAINPVTSGSGSSLKFLDYLAAGLPVVTTPEGARGFTGLDGAAIVVDVEDFPETIGALAREGGKREAMASRARELAVERFDWHKTLEAMRHYFQG
ncbi:MAG: glycosyltransferase family 4 protein [Candidatus Sumerlaeia bacterium]|nr:glycosyltransferase family 4 protein [Candidatus Sumerlaeia bacterium]